MFAAPRKSITALFFGGDEEIIGKEISRPTSSFATRAWAEDQGRLEQKMNPNSTDLNGMESTEAMQTELKHAHMSLMAERARVQELEAQLKSITEKKYTNQSNIIDQLRSSQDKLREKLHLAIRSKMDLCESTSLEIERLRLIISELTNTLSKLTGNDAQTQINIESILNKYNNSINNMKSSQNNNNIIESKYNDSDQDDLKQSSQQQHSNNNMMYPPVDNRSLQEQLNNPLSINPSLPRHLQPFPHRDIGRIDIRTISPGDGMTYPDPFAAVDLKYTGYKFITDSNQWTKFTSTNISSTVFETRLGNHENIIGLEQAVLSMTKGEVARVWVPSRLGYGVHGAEPLIPPNTDLVFELTLVEIRNDFALGVTDDIDPMDAHENPDENMSYQRGGSEYSAALTTNNLNTLQQNLSQTDPMNDVSYSQGNDQYNSQDNELLYGGIVEDNYTQQNTFQVL